MQYSKGSYFRLPLIVRLVGLVTMPEEYKCMIDSKVDGSGGENECLLTG